jgi:acetyl esterase/lipase
MRAAIRIVTAATLLASTASCKTERSQQGSDTSMGMQTATGEARDSLETGSPSPDAQMKAVLDQLAALGGKPIETLSAPEARKQPTPTDAVKELLKTLGRGTTPEPGVSSVDRTMPGARGPIPARVYTPTGGTGPYPVVVYYHGGGWVIANKDVYDGGARALSKLANAVVVSVDYSQGPEHKFPAAHDDAFAAYKWVVANAKSIGGDAKRIALAGESAGGGLAVATAIRARDEKVQMPTGIVSVYPIAGTDTTTPSYVRNAAAKPLNRAMMSWFFDKYLRTEADRRDPRVNLVAADLKGLPPTTILNAEIDVLLSEGEMLAQKLRDAGVTVEQRTYPAVTHEFFGMAAVVDKAKDAEQKAADALKASFGR